MLCSERRRFLVAVAALVLPLPVRGAGGGPPAPGPRDVCPVCGMLVAKYPNWIAILELEDGKPSFFDGAKDLFKYFFDLQKAARGRKPPRISRLWVTEYYGLTRVDARTAFYVVGSDVLGPMGHELVPLASGEEAEEFLADHKGRRILRFDDVTFDTPEKLDSKRFD